MKTEILLRGLLSATLASSLLSANESCTDHLGCVRPDGHAPIGVMGDHVHHAGEFMLSYRYHFMRMEGLNVSDHQAMAAGFSLLPTEMTMDMHMFGLMYAPCDTATLMLMTHYMQNDMEMRALPHSGSQGMPDDMHAAHGVGHQHSSSGIGDTTLSALLRLLDREQLNAVLTLGLGLPAAEVEEKEGERYLPYGMQLGTGLWDFRPALTINGPREHWSWGGQVSARFALEDENDAGFQFGERIGASAWLAKPLCHHVSVSARLAYEHVDEISGHYNGPHGHSAPPHVQENYGGDWVTGFLGLNLVGAKGFLQGHRLALEVGWPLDQDLNGIQLESDHSLTLGWQKAF